MRTRTWENRKLADDRAAEGRLRFTVRRDLPGTGLYKGAVIETKRLACFEGWTACLHIGARPTGTDRTEI
jgi:hypothetical protein